MSAAWTPLLATAMVGTERQSSAQPHWPGAIGQSIDDAMAQAADAPTALLRASGMLAACSLAGLQGVPSPLPASITQAEPDTLPALQAWPDGQLPHLITWALQEGPPRLHHQICLALAGAGYRLPPRLLPAALDLGRRSVALRPVLAPVLGERGRWLASQREDWRYAVGVSASAPEETRWTDGSLEQRRAFLAAERATQPEQARQRLAQALAELGAKERADLVGVLADQLSLQDEPLLDGLRTDRSREVRASALELLLRLPEAAHPRRAADRMAPLVRHERALLRKRWVIDAPEAVGADWKADNLDTPRPQHEALGERAWWLYQLVRQVPLGWWTMHTSLSASELIEWARGTDWAQSLLRGWRDVLLAAPQTDWAQAFIDTGAAHQLRTDVAAILALLPRAAREKIWQQRLDKEGVTVQLYTLAPQMLAACPPADTLSAPLSAALADILLQRARLGTLRDDYGLRSDLAELGCALHPDVLPALAQWPRHADETPSFATVVHDVMQVIATRRALQPLSTTPTTHATP